MKFVDSPPSDAASKQRCEILSEFSLMEGKTDLLILLALMDMTRSNVYKLSKRLPNVGHYSTVLRALKRLEKKRLVKVLPSETKSGRNRKVYTMTVLGEIVAALARFGWKAAAQVACEKSTRFSECIQVNQSFEPYHYLRLIRDVMRRIMRIMKMTSFGIEVNLDEIVTSTQFSDLSPLLNEMLLDPNNIPKVSTHLKKLSTVDWIRPLVIGMCKDYEGFLDKDIKDARESLQTIIELRRHLEEIARGKRLLD